jgi:23S rRNA (cytosine1962-C5)-methyltransferase
MNIVLKPGREKSLLRRHPWVFSGAIDKVQGDPQPGDTVDVISASGDFLARAAYSPHSQIRGRAWTFDRAEQVDVDFFRTRIRSAIRLRAVLGFNSSTAENAKGAEKIKKDSADSARSAVDGFTNAWRLIHAESDHLPGLIVDRYDDVLVLQALTAGIEHWKETIADLLIEETGIKNIGS